MPRIKKKDSTVANMSKVIAIVILYHPDIKTLQKNLNELSTQVDECILVDNSTPATSGLNFANNVVHITLNENSGIAKAQNIGLEKALEQNADYAVLFDQDSDIPKEFISKLLNTFDLPEAKANNLIAVGPRPFDIFTQKKMTPTVQKETTLSKLTLCSQIIASGKMINLSMLKTVGFFEEELFIDGVDHEWCWRAKAKGFSVAINENVIMHHQLGDARGELLGITYKIGSPIRLFYQFRNILILSRRNYVPIYWKLRNLISMPVRFLIFTVKGPRRKLRLKYMLKGIKEGLHH